MTRRYRLPTAAEAGDEYVGPPPRDDEGGEVRRVLSVPATVPTALLAGEAMAIMLDDEDSWEWSWRRRHPSSAEVFDGVHQGEAAVVAYLHERNEEESDE